MAKYDVCPLRDGNGFVLDVQAELLDHLNTRVVVPLMKKAAAPKPAQRLNPVFTIDGQPYVMVPQFLSAVSFGELRSRLNQVHHRMIAAISTVARKFLTSLSYRVAMRR